MAKAGRKRSLAAWIWVLIAATAVFELAAHPLIRAATPRDESWEAASAYVRARYRPADRIVAVPAWTDPIVRSYLGDLLSLRTAALVDGGGVDRLWEVGIRGAGSGRDAPAIEQDFGALRVRMWALSKEPLLYDFVEGISEAQVQLVTTRGTIDCPWTRASTSRGGLGHGPMPPQERFVCDPRRPWLWVGATVLTDLELRPRRCVWQHPAGVDPLRVLFPDAPLGDRIVVHAGLNYESEREGKHAPVTLRVWVGDQLAGELVHHDGDGWSSVDIDTSVFGVERASVRFETTAPEPSARLFCWSASSRRGAPLD